MKKLFVLGSLFVFLMSFTLMAHQPEPPVSSTAFKAKPIDITFTTEEGCIIHITGDFSYSVIPPKLKSFHGSIAISGPKNCPHTTLTVNYSARTAGPGEAGIEFNSEDICAITTVKWYGTDAVITDLQSNAKLNAALVAAVKEGICDGNIQ